MRHFIIRKISYWPWRGHHICLLYKYDDGMVMVGSVWCHWLDTAISNKNVIIFIGIGITSSKLEMIIREFSYETWPADEKGWNWIEIVSRIRGRQGSSMIWLLYYITLNIVMRTEQWVYDGQRDNQKKHHVNWENCDAICYAVKRFTQVNFF